MIHQESARWNHDWPSLLIRITDVVRRSQQPPAHIPERVTPETRISDLRNACDFGQLMAGLRQALDLSCPIDLESCETVQDLMDDIVGLLVGAPQPNIMASFFGSRWTEPEHSIAFKETLSKALLETRPRSILDIGCGNNYFKRDFPDAVGVDVANDAADFKCDILEFDSRGVTFDAILALGSINFGTRRSILAILKCAKNLLAKDGVIYMRVNPGIPWPAEKRLVIYPWSEDKIHDHGRETGLKCVGDIIHHDAANGKRMSFRYVHQ